MLNYLRNYSLFPKVALPFYIPMTPLFFFTIFVTMVINLVSK